MIEAKTVYAVCVTYLREAGWEREEKGSGWWWREGQTDLLMMGEALDVQLMADGIDLRVEPT